MQLSLASSAWTRAAEDARNVRGVKDGQLTFVHLLVQPAPPLGRRALREAARREVRVRAVQQGRVPREPG